MASKKPVIAGKPYTVTYASDITSGGVTLLVVVWIPNGDRPVPKPAVRQIAPNSSGSISDVVPAFDDALWVEIRVDLPDGQGSGLLTLELNDKPHSFADLTVDTTWTSLVVNG